MHCMFFATMSTLYNRATLKGSDKTMMKMKFHFSIYVIVIFTICWCVLYLGNTNNAGAYMETEKSDKWIIVTTIQAPTHEMRVLTRNKGWTVLVIGDEKTPADWKLNGTIFLSTDDQRILAYRSTRLLHFNAYTRKNVGYLFAIEHGAKVIYETDDDNEMQELSIFQHGSEKTLLPGGITPVTHNLAFNPYVHFGQSTIWPRGYPLEYIGSPQTRNYMLSSSEIPIIQQGLVNGDPDVDALFRITRKSKGKKLNLTFDGQAPNLILPSNTFAPFNSQNTLFLYEAFWALVLPISVTDRATDIYRSYWAQKLLTLIGHKLAFIPPKTFQNRNPHSYLKDAEDELEIYFNMGKLSSFLATWECPPRLTHFFKCVLKLTTDMVEKKFFQTMDFNLIDAWLKDLESFGYKEPKLVNSNNNNASNIEEYMYNNQNMNLIYYPLEQKTSMLHTDVLHFPTNTTNFHMLHYHVLSKCGPEKATAFQQRYHSNQFNWLKDILLVIRITEDIDSHNILQLESIYKMHIPHILFCGKDAWNDKLTHVLKVSYIQVTDPSAASCLMVASQIGYHVQEYVYVTDHFIIDLSGKRNKLINHIQPRWFNEVSLIIYEQEATKRNIHNPYLQEELNRILKRNDTVNSAKQIKPECIDFSNDVNIGVVVSKKHVFNNYEALQSCCDNEKAENCFYLLLKDKCKVHIHKRMENSCDLL